MGTNDTLKTESKPLRGSVVWISLILVSGVPRVLAAFLLPNPDGDEYAYVNNIEIWRASMSAGTFSVESLFGFWLPLYQLICSVICLLVDHPAYVSKLVSAVSGTGVCLLVYYLSARLVKRRIFAVLAFLFIALNPLHIMYSAFSMTDVPHAFFVLGSLYFAIERRWMLAATFVGAASLIRVESWMLIALVPLLQIYVERKVSIRALAILVVAPLIWFYISWDATGNPFEYFDTRKRYIDWLLATFSYLALTADRIRTDIDDLLYSANLVAFIGGLAGVWLICRYLIRTKIRQPSDDMFGIVATGVYFVSFLGFIVAAYFTRNQPDIFDRYGLILFVIEIPILAWTFAEVAAWKPYVARLLMVLAMLMCFAEFEDKLADVPLYVSFGNPQQIIANNVKSRCEADENMMVFCDDGVVQELSGIPKERFLSSSDLPPDREQFLRNLKEKGVHFLVYADLEDSTPVRLFPELRSGVGSELFELVAPGTRKDWHGSVWLYRFQSWHLQAN